MLESQDDNTNRRSRPERRRSARICCTGFAEGVSTNPSQLFRGEIRNVSETGCLIALKAKIALTPGSLIELQFKMGGKGYRALARVVEAVPATSIRMQFIAADPALTERIRRILSANPDTQSSNGSRSEDAPLRSES